MINYRFFKRFFELHHKHYTLPSGGSCAGYSWLASVYFYLGRKDKKLHQLLKKTNRFIKKYGSDFSLDRLHRAFSSKEQFELLRLADNIILLHYNSHILTGSNLSAPETLAEKTQWVTDKIQLYKLPHVAFHLKSTQKSDWSLLLSEYLKALPKEDLIVTCWSFDHAMAFVVNAKRNKFTAFEINHPYYEAISAKNLKSLEKKGAFDHLFTCSTFYLQAYTIGKPTVGCEPMTPCLTQQAPFCNYVTFDARGEIAVYGCQSCLDLAHRKIPPHANANKVLHFCASFGQTDIVKKILRGEYGPFTADYIDSNQLSTLMAACVGNHMEIVQMLLEYYAKHGKLSQDDLAASLHFASQYGHHALIPLLMQYTNSPDITWKHYSLPLVMACNHHHPQCIDALLKAGADPNRPDTLGHPPLLWAVDKAHIEGVKLLLSYGADPAPQKSPDGFTPLSLARQNHNQAIIDLLEQAIQNKHQPIQPTFTP